ncbi:hypothetical protein [Algoriphagus confluentis]
MKEMREKFWVQLFIIYTRFLLGGGFVFASIIKIKGKRFTTESQEDAEFGTVGHFFETMYQTGEYWQFLGWAQLISGFLLMTQKFSKLGAVINLAIILNVFVITISMDFNNTHIITFFMLLANLGLILWHWGELRILFNLPYVPPTPNLEESKPVWIYTGFTLFLFTAGYRIYTDFYDPIFWFLSCFAIVIVSFLWRILLSNNK